MVNRRKFRYIRGVVALLFLVCTGWLSAAVALGAEAGFGQLLMTQNAPMPTPTYGHALAAVDGKIYAIGGWEGGDLVQIYDTASDTWSTGAAKPTPVAAVNAAVVDGKIYLPGGYHTDTLNLLDTLEIYDPATNQWSTGAPLPMPLAAYALAAVDKKIYLIGGQADEGIKESAYVYDPEHDSWSSIAPMAISRVNAAAAVLNDKIYVSGGWHDSAEASTEYYDTDTGEWTSAGELAVPRLGHTSASGLGKLFVLGGEDPYGDQLDTTDFYDKASDTWNEVLLYLSQPCVLPQAVTVGNRIYVMGGYAYGDVIVETNESFEIPDTDAPVVGAVVVPALHNEPTVPISSFPATDNVGVTGYMVTTSSATPSAASDQWSASAPTSYTLASAGAKTLYFWAKDAAGNVSAAKSANVHIDLTAPTATATAASAANTVEIPVTFSAADDAEGSGVAGYLITATSAQPAAGAAGWSASAPTSYTVDVAGIKTLYFWAKDAAGNVSAAAVANVNVDLTAPTTTFAVKAAVNTVKVPVTVSATDNVGVTGYLITTSATVPTATTPGWSAAVPTTYTTTAGVKTLYLWAKDAAGNVSAAKSAKVNVDPTAPTTTFSVKAAVNTLKVPVTVGAADNVGGSGITGYLITTSATAPAVTATGWSATVPTAYTTTAGVKTLYLWAKDAAGNVSAAKSAKVNVDTTAPVTTFSAPAAVNTLKVPVKVTATEAVGGSGVTGYLITATGTAPLATATGWSAVVPTAYSSATAGVKTIYLWAKDAAGNVSAAKSAKVVIDAAAPVVTFSAPAVVNTLKVPVTVSATDAVGGSGLAGYIISTTATAPLATSTAWSATPPTSYTFTSAGAKTLYVWAKDAAGNVSTVKSVKVNVDNVAPVLTFTVKTPVSTLAVPVTMTATDGTGGSGVAGYMITTTSTPPPAAAAGWKASAPTSFAFTSKGSKTLYSWVKDAAGNVSPTKTATVVIQ